MIGEPVPASTTSKLSAAEWGHVIDGMVGGDRNRMAYHQTTIAERDSEVGQRADLSGNPYQTQELNDGS